jgi:hypothetical protein
MAKLNIRRTRDALQQFDFSTVFIEELGWLWPNNQQSLPVTVDDTVYQCQPLAQLGGVMVFEVIGQRFPNIDTRAKIHRAISDYCLENLLIFVDQRPKPTTSLWYWVNQERSQSPQPRQHYYGKGQPGDLFLTKIAGLFVDISELDELDGDLSVVAATKKLKEALDVEKVTKQFYQDFQTQQIRFVQLIQGIQNERQCQWYASVLLNRLMFIWFLQKKGFLDNGDLNYLPNQLVQSQRQGMDRFYSVFLKALFFEGFAKPAAQRDSKTNALLGEICYLNGGLFLPHRLEQRAPIRIPDDAFSQLFELFARYSWNLNDTPGGQDDEINPDVLGYIFEKYINQKQLGAYYTRPEITEYLSEQTIYRLILNKVNHAGISGVLPARHFDDMSELLIKLDAPLCQELVEKILPQLTLLDPACGSGAFLVAMMKTLINIYSAVIGRINMLSNKRLKRWLKQIETEHANLSYFIKKQIIVDNLFGVDIMEEATEIAKLRLFLALVASATEVKELEPLPNIDFNILTGHSLLGLRQVDASSFDKRQSDLFRQTYSQILAEKNAMIRAYRDASDYADDLQRLRDEILLKKQQAKPVLDEIFLDEFNALKISFEQATWNDKTNKAGKPIKRALKLTDFAELPLFHWGYEFDEVLHQKGGFDAIVTNPPWDVFKPQAKEFFNDYSSVVSKNKMTIKAFEKERAKLLQKPQILEAWLAYQSRFPHLSKYFRLSQQYVHQMAVVNGKKTGSDINLYKLFVEQCYHLLRTDGHCGIVIPSGIYTDLGATGLRQLLFNQTQITGLFGFENRRNIFEGVHRSFKFVVLSFQKGGNTTQFPAAFMRQQVNELTQFPEKGALWLNTDLIRRLSPDSESVMEFKSAKDIQIAEKMLSFPLLGEKITGVWNLSLTTEFHMTNDSHLFYTEPANRRLPLYEGKMIHQFEHQLAPARYWVDEQQGRAALLGKQPDNGQRLDYQTYRLGFRDVARNTDVRTMIATILPPLKFAGNTIIHSTHPTDGMELLAIAALLNSFVNDALIRQKVTAHCNMFYVYQLPIPRITKNDAAFKPIVRRAARLICTTPEFDELAKTAGIGSYKKAVTAPAKRAKLRAELDGLIAHLYGLTLDEFEYLLNHSFPLVSEEVKKMAVQEFRRQR